MALELKGTTYPLPGLHYTTREPWGVVGRMVTFNHPVMFTCARANFSDVSFAVRQKAGA